ncbi:MAG: response regulator transcription factor [Acidimicrobiia bacterium]|nr:response regulator transcription factor [Acidimicrobiia bacterium]
MRQGTVLLIEDDDDIAGMLRLHVENEGFALVHAPDGEQGLEALRTRPPRAVLLDLGLPGMDGFAVAKAIREASDIPILMITARDSETDTIIGLEVGADDYITKPFSPREVMARVHAVLRRAEDRPKAPSTVTIDGHVVDAGRRQVLTPDGIVVRPTAREFDLLWYLSDNAGLALSRAQILEAVWGYDYFGETRTVDVHIRQLRKKLPEFPIATVWGVGYRVDAS